MEKCHKRLIAALILITAAALCGAGLILYFQISQPVFLYNYGSYQLLEDQQSAGHDCWKFTLNYIANLDDRRTVTGIEFPEAENQDVRFTISEEKPEPRKTSAGTMFSNYTQPENAQNVGRYAIHSITVTVVPDGDSAGAESKVFHQAKISYSNHKTQTVAIGCVELCSTSSKDSIFSWSSDTSYGSGMTDSAVKVNGDITLLSMEPRCPADLADYIHYQVNGEDYKQIAGMKCEKGNVLNLHLESPLTENTVLKQNDYNIPVFVHYLDDQGNEHVALIDFISRMPAQYRFWDLVRYLKARNAI